MPSLRSIRLRSPLLVVLIVPAALATAVSPSNTFRVQVVADDMCCQGCVQKVAAQLYTLPGVTSVQGDVPQRLVTITAKRSPKLTLERIWQAVEKSKCSPSKLVNDTTTYTLIRAEALDPKERVTGKYLVEVAELNSNGDASAIADELYRIQGVERVGVDLDERKLAVHTSASTVISPFSLVSAAERARHQPVAIKGPFGSLTILRAAAAKTASFAPLPPIPQH